MRQASTFTSECLVALILLTYSGDPTDVYRRFLIQPEAERLRGRAGERLNRRRPVRLL